MDPIMREDTGQGSGLISKAVQKGENGKAIIFVDTFYPFFVDKFDLASHEHYAEIGSDRNEKQAVNNANLENDYAPLYQKRLKEYNEREERLGMLSAMINSGEYDKTLTVEEMRENQNRQLVDEFFNNPDEAKTLNGGNEEG